MRIFVFSLLLSVSVLAEQTASAPAPQLSELEVVKIQNIELRLALLQAEIAKVQAEATTFLKSLQKPGFTLERTSEGLWRYTPVLEKK